MNDFLDHLRNSFNRVRQTMKQWPFLISSDLDARFIHHNMWWVGPVNNNGLDAITLQAETPRTSQIYLTIKSLNPALNHDLLRIRDGLDEFRHSSYQTTMRFSEWMTLAHTLRRHFVYIQLMQRDLIVTTIYEEEIGGGQISDCIFSKSNPDLKQIPRFFSFRKSSGSSPIIGDRLRNYKIWTPWDKFFQSYMRKNRDAHQLLCQAFHHPFDFERIKALYDLLAEMDENAFPLDKQPLEPMKRPLDVSMEEKRKPLTMPELFWLVRW